MIIIENDIDRARLTLSNVSGVICTAEFSICKKRVETVFVRPSGCTSDVKQIAR